MAKKLEKRCWKELETCPATKNIRDFELKHKKAQADREAAEIKRECCQSQSFGLRTPNSKDGSRSTDYEAVKESEASKTILFKTHMKRLNEELVRQNEAERVLLTAMAVSGTRVRAE